jgi:hypothetical protein
VQVEPINPTLKAPGTKRSKLKHDYLLSSFAFNFILRRYTKECAARQSIMLAHYIGRGLNSSSFELKMSRV